MLLGKLGASLLENILADKGINRDGEGVFRVGYGNKRGRKPSAERQDPENKIGF